ncbi:hypothetical protein BD626DRAFT_30531 [Schizophyllum amplum]|uniref:Uncharacterized protein n=1 Tax=Schizophyllum amplum TaxID=97359 RepID=A0A550D0K4_9AGAR|nr:hypothetical protein BD626DRAFT_30531 [Auriculariopsis ampla]
MRHLSTSCLTLPPSATPILPRAYPPYPCPSGPSFVLNLRPHPHTSSQPNPQPLHNLTTTELLHNRTPPQTLSFTARTSPHHTIHRSSTESTIVSSQERQSSRHRTDNRLVTEPTIDSSHNRPPLPVVTPSMGHSATLLPTNLACAS